MTPDELEAARPLRKAGDTDAVTYSWADPAAGLYGLVRVATGLSAGGAPQHSALAVAFAGRRPLGAVATAGAEPPAEARAELEAPLERWSVRGEGELAFALRFDATTAPAEYGGRQATVKAGGMEGYEQLCEVRGTVRVGGQDRPVRGLGQRGHAWGNPDWDAIALTRAVSVWLEDGSGVLVHCVRGVKTANHADEAMWSAALDGERTRSVDEARLSTTTDGDGRQIRAGLELFIDSDDESAYRGLGEVLTGSTLELGALRLDCAFFGWHVDGRAGVGRYDVIRKA